MDKPETRKPKPDADLPFDDQEKVTDRPSRSHFYTKWWFWTLLTICILSVLMLFLWARTSMTKTFVSEQWHRIVLASYSAEDAMAQSDLDEDDLDDLRASLTGLEREADDVEFQSGVANGLFHGSGPRSELSEIAIAVSEYSARCADTLASVRSGSVDDAGFNVLSAAEKDIAEKYEQLRIQIKRDDQLPRSVLGCSEFLQDLDNRYQLEQQRSQEQQKAEEEKTKAEQEAAEAEVAEVRKATETFIDGQAEGDPAKVESVMVTGYAREYDFDALRGERFDNYKVAYYRINEVNKQDDGDYEVVVSVTYEGLYIDSGGENQSYEQTQQVNYEVVLGPGQERWLINREIR